MISEIDLTAFAACLVAGGAYVIDVREAHEYRSGHVPGARNMPLSVLPVRMAELPRDRPVYVICQSGGRSAEATALMGGVGVHAVNVAGGTAGWIAGHRPVETGA